MKIEISMACVCKVYEVYRNDTVAMNTATNEDFIGL